MSGSRKRASASSSNSQSSSSPNVGSSTSSSCFKPKRRAVIWRTVEKWINENDRKLSTSVWLKFDMADRDLMKCSVCSEFSTKLVSIKNFKPAFIDGSSNARVSAVQHHAATDMHTYAMLLLKKQQSSSVVDYASIAKCFAEASKDQPTREKTKKKFDICDWLWEKGHIRAYFQNRVIGTAG